MVVVIRMERYWLDWSLGTSTNICEFLNLPAMGENGTMMKKGDNRNEEMKFLYKPDLRIHTIHTTDVVRAVFTSARWMTELGRRKADEKAGVNVASSWALDEKPDVKIEVVDPKKKIIVPLFNLVSVDVSYHLGIE